ncbi:MAG TPA: SsrA-binding protein SmpB [Anaeromyxobacter sp.]
MKGKRGAEAGEKVVASNRRARFDYEIGDTWEAGLVLTGSEVKSLRAGNVNLSDAYAAPRGEELFLLNCRIGEYQQASHFGHAPLRDRKLLMKRAELDRIRGKVDQRGFTLVPLRVYFRDGWAKVEIGLAKGRAHEDRRGVIAERESKREMDRALGRARRRERG